MNQQLSKIVYRLLLVLFLIFSGTAYSQGSTPPPPPGGTPGFGDDVNDETGLPIDSHLIVLCAGGVALGYFVIKKNELVKLIRK